MVRKDGAFIKTQRLQTISKAIARTFPEGIEKSKALDNIEYDMGLRRATAEAYLNMVLSKQGWIVVDGRIKAQ